MSTPTTPQPQMMMGPPMCPPTWMSMFPQMMGAQPAFEDGGQAYARVPGFRNGMEKKVTTTGIPICKLPKVRLLEGIEFLEETLDSTLTAAASCDQVMLPIIIWSTKSSSGQERVLALAEAACGLALS